jgi:hypothetical protein
MGERSPVTIPEGGTAADEVFGGHVQGVEVAGDGLAEPDGGSCCSPSRVLADLGLRYDEPLRLPERMSITTLAVLVRADEYTKETAGSRPSVGAPSTTSPAARPDLPSARSPAWPRFPPRDGHSACSGTCTPPVCFSPKHGKGRR